jgi:twitching motility protein PilT
MSTVHIDRLLDTVIKQGASDLHLTVDKPPTLRLHGRLRELKTKVLDPDDTVALMKSITPERAQQELQEEGTCDFGFAYGDGPLPRLDVPPARQHRARAASDPQQAADFEQIGLPPIVKELMPPAARPVPRDRAHRLGQDHVAGVDDRLHQHHARPPHHHHRRPDRVLPPAQEVDRQPARGGQRRASFAEALRRALRQDPDVMLVGEMRDLETIEAAISAAETGHLVFGTLHTTSAGGTINRIVDAFPVEQQNQIRVQLSDSLMAVLSQQLLPRVDTRA